MSEREQSHVISAPLVVVCKNPEVILKELGGEKTGLTFMVAQASL